MVGKYYLLEITTNYRIYISLKKLELLQVKINKMAASANLEYKQNRKIQKNIYIIL